MLVKVKKTVNNSIEISIGRISPVKPKLTVILPSGFVIFSKNIVLK